MMMSGERVFFVFWGSLLGVSLPASQVRITLAILIRGRQVLSISRSAPRRVLRTVEQMRLFAVERLDGTGPVATVDALHRFALML